ncbi:MAG: VCBS repeat-containing protein [Pirellulaceae bacterium]
MNVKHETSEAGRGGATSAFHLLDILLGLVAIILGLVLLSRVIPGNARQRISSPIEVPGKSPAVSWTRHDLSLPLLVEERLVELLLPEGEKMEDQSQEHRVTHVQIADFDKDGVNDVIACDGAGNQVVLFQHQSGKNWKSTILANRLLVPAHATIVDIDQDDDNDLIVSLLGDILPSDELVGSVVLLKNEGDHFTRHLLLDDVRRVADVQPGDLDGDGDLDLAVAVFGYGRGEILWLENLGEQEFQDHLVISRPGVIHVPIADYDGDGDLDPATIVSQDDEEVWVFENDGQGNFTNHMIYLTHNYDVGGGGLVASDLDQDGDMDFLLSQGDNLEFGHGWPQPYHGCVWVRNDGDWNFSAQQIGALGGTYATNAGDLDQDGDLDLVMVSMSNDWTDSSHPTIAWVENDGKNNFQRTLTIDTAPVELITLDVGDIDGDGIPDLVAGRLRVPTTVAPESKAIAVWLSGKAKP